jgi:NAD(P)-dependent dehydrogenase (short-subunit alcohol dehydrogenase family)
VILDGKVALVTGAAAGIGRAAALVFAREGARVVVADLDEVRGRETVSTIEKQDRQATFVKVDVRIEEEVAAAVSAAVSHFGELHCAFNNAGVSGARLLTHEYDEVEWEMVVDVHMKGVWLCMKHEIKHMLDHGGGAIVNTSSVAGLVGYPGACPYVAAKHGIVGMSKSAALEYAERGLRVNCVNPGWTRTELIGKLIATPESARQIGERHPLGRLAEPDEIAEAAVWLCSDKASFVTGVAFPVDGGFVAR